jgi:L-asparaginase II
VNALLEVVRNGFVESRHRGTFVFLDPDGVSLTEGDPSAPILPRSSLKPLQATAMVRSGLRCSVPSLALAAASHDGAEEHRAGVRATLAAATLDETALRCPPDLPLGREAMVRWLAGGHGPARICHNCSGKHAAMTATCIDAGWPVATYLDPDHPLQRAVRETIEDLCGEPVSAVAVDGCGAPAFAVSLLGLARAFSRLASEQADDLRSVRDAMRSHPTLVGGAGRAVTDLMAAVDGLIAKDGAEAVWAAALPDGRAFAAKLEDGSSRAQGPLLAAAAAYWGAGADPVVQHWSTVPLFGGGRPVGAVRWSDDLRRLLRL